MKVYGTKSLRNIALASHQGVGKTSLVEAFLFNNDVVSRLGEVTQGTTASDFEEEEIARGMSLNTSQLPIEAKGTKFNFLDTPGFTDFQGDVKNSLRVSDLLMLLVDGNAGVEVGTEIYWGFADEFQLPRMVVVNKMDRDTARKPERLTDELKEIFGARFVSIQHPMGVGENFSGVIDLLTMKAYAGIGESAEAIPSDFAEEAAAARRILVEAAAEADDALLETFFEVDDLTDEELLKGVKAGVLSGEFIPVAYTSATDNVGAVALFDLLGRIAPSPDQRSIFTAKQAGEEITLTADDSGPLALYIFKTTADPFVGKLTYFRIASGILNSDNRYHNHSRDEEERVGPLYSMLGKEQISLKTMHAGDIGAVAKLGETITCDTLGDKGSPLTVPPPTFPSPVYAVAVTPSTQGDSAKMGPTLTRLCDEDPTLRWGFDPSTKEAILEGMGDVHVSVAINRAEQLGVNLDTAIPRVPYRETITKIGKARYRHKKQSGGAGQFAEVYLRLEPQKRGEGFEYKSEVVGGKISHSFIPSIEKGIKGIIEEGVISGYPVVDVKAIVYDGKEHPVDSKDIAFQIAGRGAFRDAMKEASPVILEPVVEVRVTVPETNMGDVIGDLSSRRAQVQGTESFSGKAIVTATVPLVEVQRYSNDLRSFTQGRGVYTLEFSHYQPVPSNLATKIVAEHQKEEEE